VVNASLNWASIVGIVLAVGGALLYFMRSFKPALARDYDVFFAAVGLLCGGILFFQGWRLDPILQFGQFLLAGTTVFFAYESVRLRGVTTEQARRSSYFDDEEPAGPYRPQMGGRAWGNEGERFDEPEPIRRRIRSREDEQDADDFYRPRRPSRAAIPERAASRRDSSREDWGNQEPPAARRSGAEASPASSRASDFGARRRDARSPEPRRGSRPSAIDDAMPRSSRRGPAGAGPSTTASRAPQGEPLRSSRTATAPADAISDADFRPMGSPTTPASGPAAPGSAEPPRDNSSRFDD
jgi:hypothetical protein